MGICGVICINISILPLWCRSVIHLTSISVKYPISFPPFIQDSECTINLIAVSGFSANVAHDDNSFPVLYTSFSFISITQNAVFVLQVFIYVK